MHIYFFFHTHTLIFSTTIHPSLELQTRFLITHTSALVLLLSILQPPSLPLHPTTLNRCAHTCTYIHTSHCSVKPKITTLRARQFIAYTRALGPLQHTYTHIYIYTRRGSPLRETYLLATRAFIVDTSIPDRVPPPRGIGARACSRNLLSRRPPFLGYRSFACACVFVARGVYVCM